MKYIIKAIAICIIVSGPGMGCKKNYPEASTANLIMGDIYDANGNKFAIGNSTVTVHVWSPNPAGGADLSYDIEMDGNSQYKQKVASGNYTYDARASVLLNGNRVNVALEPVDGKPADEQFDSDPGVTRDFKLSLTALIPGGDPTDAFSYYGGHIYVCDGATNFTPTGSLNNLAVKYPGYTVNFRLTGSSNCIDGSTSPILDIRCRVEDLQGVGTYLANFPLARYYMTALLRSPTGQQTSLKLTFVAGAQGNHYNFLDFSFSPALNDPDNWPSTIYVAVWEN